MPIQFTNCIKQGGRVRTKRINKDEYMHICFLNGKSFPGEVKKYKKLNRSKSKIA